MARIIVFGLNAEGSTDYKFLIPLIERTLEDILKDCDVDVELYDVMQFDTKVSGEDYPSKVLRVANEAEGFGVECLIFHLDADRGTRHHVMEHKIQPAFERLKERDSIHVLPLIPVQETEAWMLADKACFKRELGLSDALRDIEIDIEGNPERFADPKTKIQNAIRYANESRARRHRRMRIDDMYQPLGNKISLDSLKRLNSYGIFYEELKRICFPYCHG